MGREAGCGEQYDGDNFPMGKTYASHLARFEARHPYLPCSLLNSTSPGFFFTSQKYSPS
jgi:hypothetical protein